jgi:hypothetical protein
MPHYLDEPFVLELVTLEGAQAALKVLAYWQTSLLPERHRAICARMVFRLKQIERELRQCPDDLTAERAREDRRGETTQTTPAILRPRADGNMAKEK